MPLSFLHPGDLSLSDLARFCAGPAAFLALLGVGLLLFRLGRRYFK
jgi:hypothetical protein